MLKGRGAWVIEWGLGLLILAAILIWGDLGDMDQLLHAKPFYLILGLVSTLPMALTSSVKLRTVIRQVAPDGTPSWKQLFYYFFLARVTGLIAPMAVSDAGVRMVSLRVGHRIGLTHAGYAIYIERAFDLIVVLLALLPSILFLTGRIPVMEAVILLAVILVLAGLLFDWKPLFVLRALTRVFLVMRRLVGRIPWLARLLGKGRQIEGPVALPIRRGQAMLLYVMSVVGMFALAVRFYFILCAVRVELGLLPLLLCVPVAQMATLLAITPGGLGILEAGWYGIFALVGMPGPQIVLSLVSSRAFVVIYILICYGLAWAWVRSEPRSEARVTGEAGEAWEGR